MKNLKTIKVFRYDEKENVWAKHEIENVFIAGFKESYNLSYTMDKNVSQILRVMGDCECDVSVSDRIVLMPYDGNTPPDNALVVVSVTKNVCGENTAHTKILCR
jgi:hypothetical protein